MKECPHYKKQCPLKQGDAYCLHGDAHFHHNSQECDKLIKKIKEKKHAEEKDGE